MEVEVKLRLADLISHQRLSNILSPYHLKTIIQENIFFDGANSELSSNLAALRLRFYDLDSHCIISLKSKPQIFDGISRIEEDEEPLDPSLGRGLRGGAVAAIASGFVKNHKESKSRIRYWRR